MTDFLRKNRMAAAGLIVIALLALTAAAAPWLAPYDPAVQDLARRLEKPSWRHPFGNDELGRDILSRLMMGARVSMRAGATVVLFCAVIGVLAGGFAGDVCGRLDTIKTAVVIN
jgi:peptide/nickel transport system permease protein